MNRTFRSTLVIWLLTAGLASAALKVWVSGETIQSADLNSNFSQINATAGGLVTNARVSSTAAIASSKLAGYRLMPRMWASLTNNNSTCSTTQGSNCTETTAGLGSIVGTGDAGTYEVRLGYTASNSDYAPQVGIQMAGSTTAATCGVYQLGTTNFTVRCLDIAGAPLNMGFTVVVYDND